MQTAVMKKNLIFFCWIILLSLPSLLFSQQRSVTGRVTDSSNSPLADATVSVVGKSINTKTKGDGSFTINVPSSANQLKITYVGYQDKTISITSDNLTVNMTAATSNLSDVVVIGYGTARRKDVTGAVAAVSSKNFNQGVVTNPIQQIQGKVSGLVITVPGGDPNSSPIIRLRGQTSLTGGQTPLIVVDGVPLDDPNQLNNIPPGDIASYDVLKDASATAIYGSRGANGVIIVNTKRGQSGQVKVDYDAYVGVEKQSKKYDFLSGDEWRKAVKDPGSFDKGANTDWQDEINRTALSHSHSLGISGGAKGFNYRGSVSYIDQQGIIINTGKQQLGLRFNAQQRVLDDRLEFQVGAVNTQTNRDLLNYGNISKIFNTPPVYPVYNKDGSYFAFSDFEQFNAVEHLNLETNKAKEYLTLLYGTVNYELIRGLRAGVTGSISHFNRQTSFFQPSYPLEGNNNNASAGNENKDSRKGDIHINYIKDFGKNNFNLTGVYEYNYFTNNAFSGGGQQYLVPENENNNFGSSINPIFNRIGSYKEEYKLISFLGRLNYNYNSKYYVTASLRRDGSSKFGKNNRWGNFPSVDVAWRLSQEDFMKGIGWISDLKLRAGYGVTGNSDAISPYATNLLYGPSGRYYNAATGSFPQSYSPIQNENPDLRWEERRGKNIGLDFGFLNNRITGDINVFRDKTVNLLFDYTVPVPPFFRDRILANVGTLSNKGVELAVTAQVVRGRKFTWTASGQITFIKTKVESLSGTYRGIKVNTNDIGSGYGVGRGLSSYNITFLKPGYAPYVFYIPHYLGVDKDGNQLLDSAGKAVPASNENPSKHYIDPNPDFNYGLNNTLTYGSWTLNFFLRGVHGQKIFNNTLLNFENVNRLPGNNVTKEALTNGIKDAATISDLWLQNASYLRLDNATLGYTFPHVSRINNLRVYVAANNLFVITPYRGLDPEIRVAESNLAYIDVTYYGEAFYPRTRSFTFGVNVSF